MKSRIERAGLNSLCPVIPLGISMISVGASIVARTVPLSYKGIQADEEIQLGGDEKI